MSALVISHGAVRRAGRVVLGSAQVHVSSPVAIAVIGVNGSGKSSLFMQLTDTLRASGRGAHLTLAGRKPTLAYVPQNPALPPWLRVDRVPRAFGLAWRSLSASMPELLLHELAGRRVEQLSVGQRQALALAVALGRCADLTLLDEPFSALDFRRRVGAQELLRRQVARGHSIMLSSQSAADLAGVCTHFLVIRDGAYVFNGALSELVTAPSVEALEQRLLQLLI